MPSSVGMPPQSFCSNYPHQFNPVHPLPFRLSTLPSLSVPAMVRCENRKPTICQRQTEFNRRFVRGKKTTRKFFGVSCRVDVGEYRSECYGDILAQFLRCKRWACGKTPQLLRMECNVQGLETWSFFDICLLSSNTSQAQEAIDQFGPEIAELAQIDNH